MRFCIACLMGWLSCVALAEPVDFQRDVRPILSANCFACHGPDEQTREADLRLDMRAEAMADLGGHAAIVPGDPGASELIARIATDDPIDVMPPPESKKSLKPEEIEILRKWIADGAVWPRHWAFETPKRPKSPAVSDASWVSNPIDAFVLARLDREGLTPSPEADRVTLLRRLHLDLIGLPPTVEDLEAFLADTSDDAYENAVARLLESPHYGERWARHWLDAAQYADSDGFEKDKPRAVWAWRDWVIDAFNANMPYDAFVTKQIAGDLLPDATQADRVATGYLRNSMINEEGGIDPEQFRMEALFNRMDVIGRSVMGLTVQCAQCHTHKYDPIAQTDYYRMLAYINNAYEANITVYSDDEQVERATVLDKIAGIEAKLKSAHPDWRERMETWARGIAAQPEPAWHALDLTFDDSSAGGQKFVPQGDGSYLASGYAPTRFHPKAHGESPIPTIAGVKIEFLTDPNLPRGGPGRSIYGSLALSEFQLRKAPEDRAIKEFGEFAQATIASAIADINPPKAMLGPEYPQNGENNKVTGPIAFAIDGDMNTAWSTDIGPERRNENHVAILTLAEPFSITDAEQIAVQLSQNHGGHNSNDNQTNNLGRFRISVTGDDALPATAVTDGVRRIAATPAADRTDAETRKLFRVWRKTVPDFFLFNMQIERA